MKFFNVVTKEAAQSVVAEYFRLHLKTGLIPIQRAVGRVCAEDVFSRENLPDYRRSLVDGYAVVSESTFGASDAVPSVLRQVGSVTMGEMPSITVHHGECVYVPTGGAVPDGADAMVMIEHTQNYGKDIAVYRPIPPSENIIGIGGDIRSGACILSKDSIVNVRTIGVLAACGIERIMCYLPISFGIISTGDEIVEITSKSRVGQIRDVNTVMLATMIADSGNTVDYMRKIGDGYEVLTEAVRSAADKCDVVLVSGGSSIGARDFTERVLGDNGEIIVHGIALKPGKPTIISRSFDKLCVGLPGHPMACMLTMRLIVLDALLALHHNSPRTLRAVARIGFPSSPGRLTVQPVRLIDEGGVYFFTPLFYKSGMVSVMPSADGFILIDSVTEGITAGDTATVYLM